VPTLEQRLESVAGALGWTVTRARKGDLYYVAVQVADKVAASATSRELGGAEREAMAKLEKVAEVLVRRARMRAVPAAGSEVKPRARKEVHGPKKPHEKRELAKPSELSVTRKREHEGAGDTDDEGDED
jgi:hypothetical protein